MNKVGTLRKFCSTGLEAYNYLRLILSEKMYNTPLSRTTHACKEPTNKQQQTTLVEGQEHEKQLLLGAGSQGTLKTEDGPAQSRI